MDEPSDSDVNEYMARKAICDLLEEHKGSMTAVQLKLSVWLDEEFLRRFHTELKDLDQ
jgi:hypothetical protein